MIFTTSRAFTRARGLRSAGPWTRSPPRHASFLTHRATSTTTMKVVRVRERLCDTSHHVADFLHALPDDHPLQIALRTYSLALALALGPALLPFVTSRRARSKGIARVLSILKRELSPNAFASAITVGVAGGAAVRRAWAVWEEEDPHGEDGGPKRPLESVRAWAGSLKDWQKSFLSNVLSSTLAIALLHSRKQHSTSAGIGRPSPTLDLSLLFIVRAMDAAVQMALFKPPETIVRGFTPSEQEEQEAVSRKWTTRLDALVFWACSAR